MFKPANINKQSEFVGSISNIVTYFEDMREIMLERLLTEREEENNRWKFLLITMEKSRSAQNVIVQLNKTLEEKVKDKYREVSILLNNIMMYVSLFKFIYGSHPHNALTDQSISLPNMRYCIS